MPTDHDVMRIFERQMRNWELARSQHHAENAETGGEVADFICISREIATGAMEIAARLGQQLRWPVFDKEILHVMAGDDAVRERIYASMDERDLSWSEQVLCSLKGPAFVRDDYFHKLSKTVLLLARKGSAVFVGRGADLILPRDRGLRVRIIAPRAERLRRLAAQQGLSDAKARAELQRLEEERAVFIRHHFGLDATDPARHDLVINLARISPTQAADMILAVRTILQPG